jgi:DNA-binding NarL/FixJ family response regulator
LVEEHQQWVGEHANHDPYEQLTDREREVFKLVAEGYTTREIASMLVVSAKTVEGHKTNLMAKLGIRNRIELVKYALRRGIIST